MNKLIGIIPDIELKTGRLILSPDYYNSVYMAGGIPIVIPLINRAHAFDVLERVDGLILSGGDDVDPLRIGEEPHPNCGQIIPLRDEIELGCAQYALENEIPTLGICRGLQVMAITCKCPIIQDIGSQWQTPIKHKQQAPRWYPTHHVRIDQKSKLHKIYMADEILVNSFHHQSVHGSCNQFMAVGFSHDDIIEAMEHETHPFYIGVQWHPENMAVYNQAVSQQRQLFEGLVQSI